MFVWLVKVFALIFLDFRAARVFVRCGFFLFLLKMFSLIFKVSVEYHIWVWLPYLASTFSAFACFLSAILVPANGFELSKIDFQQEKWVLMLKLPHQEMVMLKYIVLD